MKSGRTQWGQLNHSHCDQSLIWKFIVLSNTFQIPDYLSYFLASITVHINFNLSERQEDWSTRKHPFVPERRPWSSFRTAATASLTAIFFYWFADSKFVFQISMEYASCIFLHSRERMKSSNTACTKSWWKLIPESIHDITVDIVGAWSNH